MIPTLQLPPGQRLQFPLSQYYSFSQNSFPNPVFSSEIHPDFVLQLHSVPHLTHPSFDDILSFSAIIEIFFQQAQNL